MGQNKVVMSVELVYYIRTYKKKHVDSVDQGHDIPNQTDSDGPCCFLLLIN